MFSVFDQIVDHGSQHSSAMKALVRWQHPVTLSEAQDVLHRAMRLASHRRIRMTIEIASDLPAFFIVVDSLFAHNVSSRPCYGEHK